MCLYDKTGLYFHKVSILKVFLTKYSTNRIGALTVVHRPAASVSTGNLSEYSLIFHL